MLTQDQLSLLVAFKRIGHHAILQLECTAPPYCLWQMVILSTGCCRLANHTLGAKRHIVCERPASPIPARFRHSSCPRSGISRRHAESPEGTGIRWMRSLAIYFFMLSDILTICKVFAVGSKRRMISYRAASITSFNIIFVPDASPMRSTTSRR